jgi:MEMO1 family protein
VFGNNIFIKQSIKMKKIFCCFAFILFVSSCKGEKLNTSGNEADSTRLPVFAGQFYSSDSLTLFKSVKTFIDNAEPAIAENTVAIIIPHAGHIYSGQIAADAFNQVKNNKYDVIVILGTNHTTRGFSNIGIYPHGAFSTPMGIVKIDDGLSEDLLKEDTDITANLAVHAKEHSIEVQIPFIKYLFPGAKIVPLIVGEPDIQMCERFGKALAKVLKIKKALIIASSDLSHYPSFDNAVKVDNVTLKTIAGMNLSAIKNEMNDEVDKNIDQLVTCACGEAPIMAAVAAAKELGASYGKIISYSNSGYSSVGSFDKVVGYGAVALCAGKIIPPADVDTLINDPYYKLTPSDKKALLKYVRKTLEQYFDCQTLPLPRDINPKLKIKRGAFVTLKKNGELRGCIGNMSETTPLCTVVGSMALQAAFYDSRFPQLKQDELSKVELEISVLTPFLSVKSADEIVLGRDGVVVKKSDKQAVYLPQVATETGWNKETFLDQLCYKAGLNAGDWKNASLYTFQADVFSEVEFK